MEPALLSNSVLYPFIACFSLILNTVELILIFKKWKILKTYEQLLLSLALSDVITVLTVIIFGVIDLFTNDFPNLGEKLFLRVLLISFTFSLANLLLISLDRMIAIRYPLKHKIWMTRCRMARIIIIMWIVIIIILIIQMSIAYAMLRDIRSVRRYFHVQFQWMSLVSVGVFAAIYAYIMVLAIRQAWRNDKCVNSNTTKADRDSSFRTFKQQQPIIATCLLVVICYMLCTCPFAIELIMRKDKSRLAILFFANTAIDPMVYFFKGFLERKMKMKSLKRPTKKQVNFPQL